MIKKLFIVLLVLVDVVLFLLIAISLLSGWRYGGSAPQNTVFPLPPAINQVSTDQLHSIIGSQGGQWNPNTVGRP